jgi:glycosyltransferase involved in cell wall biosynthesis
VTYQKLGAVENKKLLYKRASLVVNPMLFGTGIKIKNVESLGYGMPLITTPVGAEGLEERANIAFLVAQNAEDFAQKVIITLSDKELRSNLSQLAFQFAQEINDKNVNNLKSVLNLDDSGG